MDASDVNHGFVRAQRRCHHHVRRSGRWDRPLPRHHPSSNNPVGAITGYYIDANDVTHGFLRTRKRSCARRVGPRGTRMGDATCPPTSGLTKLIGFQH